MDEAKPEALELAEWIEGDMTCQGDDRIAALLRAQHAEIESLRAQVEALRVDGERYRFLAAHCRSVGEHWGGRWSIVIEGPVPKSHNSEDDFDAAIDAAKGEKNGT